MSFVSPLLTYTFTAFKKFWDDSFEYRNSVSEMRFLAGKKYYTTFSQVELTYVFLFCYNFNKVSPFYEMGK